MQRAAKTPRKVPHNFYTDAVGGISDKYVPFGSSIAFHLFTIFHANNAEIFISSFMKVKNRFFGSVADQIGNIQWEWMCPTPDFKVKHFHEDMMKHFVRHNHIFEPE